MIAPAGTVRGELRRLAILAWPVALGQIAQLGLGLADLIMVGRLGELELAGLAAGGHLAFGLQIFGMGVLMGLDGVFAQAHGAGAGAEAGRALSHGLLLSVLVSLPVTVGLYFAEPLLRLFGQSEEVIPIATAYAQAMALGTLPFVLFFAFRQFLQGQGLMRPAMWVTLGANLVNVAGNWVLIFGHLGAPALGAEGAGWCTSAVRALTVVALVGLGWKPIAASWSGFGVNLRRLWELALLGLPYGAHVVMEVWAFTSVGWMMGWIGPTELAANSVALNLSSAAFMVALGIGAAASTRVGNLVGGRQRWQLTGAVAIGAGMVVMAAQATLMLLFPNTIAAIFTDDPAVAAVVISLLPFAASFAIFDGVQTVCAGVLRGLGDTRLPALLALLAFWVAGLPTGYLLAFPLGMGAGGLWAGLVLSLAVVSLALAARVRWLAVRGASTLLGAPP